MQPLTSVYIVEPDNQGWIIERLMRDLAGELASRGMTVRIGPGSGYRQEEVIFNSRFLSALSEERARVNSLFITHVDDRSKELDLKASFARFNSFVCLSPHDAEYVSALKGDDRGVVGIELPVREVSAPPIRIALFSARYDDGRKNERWLIDFFRNKSAADRGAVTLCFLGWGWESFCEELGELEMSYEIHRYSRYTPGEYEMYKTTLAGCDVLVYPGFDGGAMSVYDGLNAGIEVLASNISYHRGLGDFVALFDDEAGFHRELGRLLERRAARIELLRSRTVSTYATRLLAHWNVQAGAGAQPADSSAPRISAERARQTLEQFREHYKPMSVSRVRSALIRWWQTRTLRS